MCVRPLPGEAAYVFRLAFSTPLPRFSAHIGQHVPILRYNVQCGLSPLYHRSHFDITTFHTSVWSGKFTMMTPEESIATATYDGKNYDVIREGLAEILRLRSDPKDLKGKKHEDKASHQQTVFYNPIQQYNRDISVLAIRTFSQDLAAIRKARHNRRLQGFEKNDARGKKRKRTDDQTDPNVEVQPNRSIVSTDSKEALGNAKGPTDDATCTGLSLNHVVEEPGEILPSAVELKDKSLGILTSELDIDSQTGFDYDKLPKGPKEPPEKQSPNGEAHKPPPTLKTKDGARFRILDALSASGLRAIRYAKEIPLVTSVTANDLSRSATDSIKLNIRHNQLDEKIRPVTSDAAAYMYQVIFNIISGSHKGSQGKYDVVDLDPYGTAAPLLDAAVQALVDGGLLCVTCTDSAVFASTGYPEKAFSQYGGLSAKGPQAHEVGLRLVLYAIASCAARYGLAIEPLLSLSVDFYVRVFVRVRRSAAEVKFLAGKTMLAYSCDAGCGAWTTQFIAKNREQKDKNGHPTYKFTLGQAPTASPTCEHCGFKTHLSGPMWGGPLHNPYFVQQMLDELPSLSTETYGTIPRMEGMLSIALNETLLEPCHKPQFTTPALEDSAPSTIPSLNPAWPDRHPFFVIPSHLAKVLHCEAPSDAAIRGALLHLGYRVTRSHTKPSSIRTDAPWSIIWEVMREWVRQEKPVKPGAIKPGTAGWAIMQKDRRKAGVQCLKADLAAIMLNADDMEKTKIEIEAALYRASKVADEKSADQTEEDSERELNGVAAKEDKVGEKVQTETQAQVNEPSWLTRSKLKVVFDEKLGKEGETKKMVRYQLNPRPNWGPMSRAKGDVA